MPDYSHLSDKELLLFLKQHDHAAFTEIYERCWHSLYKSAYQRLRDTAVCKDIIHDVFADLWLKHDSKNIEKLLPYLQQAVRYKIYTWIANGNNTAHFVEPFESMATSAFNADSWFEAKELEKLVNLWVKTLPKKRRQIFELKHVYNLSTRQISEQLCISQKTVQNQLTNAMHELQTQLTQYFILLVIFSFFNN